MPKKKKLVKSQVTEVSYMKVRNLGDYETERIGVVVKVKPGESADTTLARAKKFVESRLESFTPLNHFDPEDWQDF